MTGGVTLWVDVVHLGRRAAQRFRLRLQRIEAFGPHRARSKDGECHVRLGIVRLRLHRVGRVHAPLARGTIMSTLAHELAHLRGWDHPSYDHGPQHGELARRIAAWLRKQGQPVWHVLHSGSAIVGTPPSRWRPAFKRAWKRPKPRRRK